MRRLQVLNFWPSRLHQQGTSFSVVVDDFSRKIGICGQILKQDFVFRAWFRMREHGHLWGRGYSSAGMIQSNHSWSLSVSAHVMHVMQIQVSWDKILLLCQVEGRTCLACPRLKEMYLNLNCFNHQPQKVHAHLPLLKAFNLAFERKDQRRQRLSSAMPYKKEVKKQISQLWKFMSFTIGSSTSSKTMSLFHLAAGLNTSR